MSSAVWNCTLVLFLLAGFELPSAGGQCLDWRTFPLSGVPEVNTVTQALEVFDDGSGPALFIGRSLEDLNAVYPPGFSGVKRWNGVAFVDVGAGLNGRVEALEVFDDGSGAALYAGGRFTIPGSTSRNIAKWDGSSWQPLGTGTDGEVYALHVHSEGAGSALFVGGAFQHFGGLTSAAIAKWDGTAWSTLAGGIPNPTGTFPTVRALTTFDDGSGPALLVGGAIAFPGPSGYSTVARWQSGTWSGLPVNPVGNPVAMVAWDDGSGPALYVGVGYNFPNQGVQRWDGQGWHPVGGWTAAGVDSLAVLDLGQGERLYCGTTNDPSFPGVRSWDGATWTQWSSTGIAYCLAPGNWTVHALCSFDEGSGPRLIAGSGPAALGSMSKSTYRWNGSRFEPLEQPVHGIQGTNVRAVHVYADGSGPALFAAGQFCGADAAPVGELARWNGIEWESAGMVGNAAYDLVAMTTYDLGSGEKLYVGGSYARVNVWDGAAWSGFGGDNAYSEANALQGFGSYVYVGGSFTFQGGVASPNLARWNGFQVSPVGTGSQAGMNGAVDALAVFDDGHGPALFAGGGFTSGNGVGLNHIGRWDGTSWTTLGSGMNGIVDALLPFDDGTGTALYAAGTFTLAGGVPASCVARWNGTSWSPVGAGLNAQVLSLGVFDDGSGSALYAGGNFTMSGTSPVSHIARWNGTTWTQLGGGADGAVWGMASFDDGSGIGPELFVGGEFHHAGGLPSDLFAAWRGCEGAISNFCFGDGSVSACPCANQGLSGRGCDNSVHAGGARLHATGTTNPDTIHLTAAGELPNAATLVFQGDALLTSPQPFGDGLRCCGGSIRRLYATAASGGALTVPGVGQPSISARSAALGDPLTPGSVRCYQAWYRDASPTFCAAPLGNAWNLSSAVRIVW